MNYRRTVRACFAGYVVQAIVNNFAPLLFLTFQSQYRIPLSKITLLITVNFGLQLTVDCASVYFIDRIGYRASALLAHFFSALGLIMLSVLPQVMPSAYAGLLLAVCFYAVGGGLLEVIISPIVEACPTKNKARTMSVLHSFYCWGSAGVIVISTLFLKLFGHSSWRILAPLWALLPIANGLIFLKTPIAPLIADGEQGLKPRALFSSRTFWLLAVLMVCAGACEHGVSEWASSFAEKGLGISKVMGDLAGPTIFALLMGAFARGIRSLAEPIQPADDDAVLRRAVRRRLSDCRSGSESSGGACRHGAMRILRGHHVAGHVQHGGRGDQKRRHGNVRTSGAGGRSGAARRARRWRDWSRVRWATI